MKNKIINVISAALIAASLILIVRYFIISANYKGNNPQPTYIEEKEYALTKAECIDCDVDLGELKLGTMISQRSVLRNTGDHPLAIKAISPDCHCTDFNVSKYLAPPGDSIVITLFVDTSDKRAGETELNTVVQTNTEKEYHLLTLICELIDTK